MTETLSWIFMSTDDILSSLWEVKMTRLEWVNVFGDVMRVFWVTEVEGGAVFLEAPLVKFLFEELFLAILK